MKITHNNFFLNEHPLIKKDITILRDKHTNPEIFRAAVKRISLILAVEISKKYHLTKIDVESPLEKTIGFQLKQNVVLVPVLRAGLGMVSGFLEVIPDAKVGHIGLQRNEETSRLNIIIKHPKTFTTQVSFYLILCLQPEVLLPKL